MSSSTLLPMRIGAGRQQVLTVKSLDGIEFPDAAASWTWTLQMDPTRSEGGTPAVSLDATSATRSADKLSVELIIDVTAAKLSAEAVDPGSVLYDLISTDGSGTVMYWGSGYGNLLAAVGTPSGS